MTQIRTSPGQPGARRPPGQAVARGPVARGPARTRAARSLAPGQPGARKPSRLEPTTSIKLTGRGAVVCLFLACFLGLLFAAWTGWSAVSDVIFVLACGAVTYYTRASGLRTVVVCPPLAFFAGTVLTEALTTSDKFSALEGMLVTLGASAPWLFAGTLLTVAIAVGRGWRPGLLSFTDLRRAMRDMVPSRTARRDLWTRR